MSFIIKAVGSHFIWCLSGWYQISAFSGKDKNITDTVFICHLRLQVFKNRLYCQLAFTALCCFIFHETCNIRIFCYLSADHMNLLHLPITYRFQLVYTVLLHLSNLSGKDLSNIGKHKEAEEDRNTNYCYVRNKPGYKGSAAPLIFFQ